MPNTKKEMFFELIDKSKRIYDASYGELTQVYIVGSQSILGISDNPIRLLEGTQDVDMLLDTYNEDYDNNIAWVAGENSQFHADVGQYIDIVKEEFLMLPTNWRDRVINEDVNTSGGKIRVSYLNINDLVFAKMYANREKDREYISKLFEFKIISPKLLNKIWKHEFSKQLILEDGKPNYELKANIAACLRFLHRKNFGKKDNNQLIDGIDISKEIEIMLKTNDEILSKKEKHIKNNTKFKV